MNHVVIVPWLMPILNTHTHARAWTSISTTMCAMCMNVFGYMLIRSNLSINNKPNALQQYSAYICLNLWYLLLKWTYTWRISANKRYTAHAHIPALTGSAHTVSPASLCSDPRSAEMPIRMNCMHSEKMTIYAHSSTAARWSVRQPAETEVAEAKTKTNIVNIVTNTFKYCVRVEKQIDDKYLSTWISSNSIFMVWTEI